MLNRSLVLGISLLLIGHAHALLLGGVEVPKEKIIVYLLIGHSNIAGIQTRNTDNVPHARGWKYTWSATPRAWVPAQEAPGSKLNGFSTRGAGGPGMPFIKQMAAAYPDHHFGVISNASTSCTCKGVNTGTNTSGIPVAENRYWKGARLYNEIVTAAKEVQANVTFGGIICMLGSVEATRSSTEVCNAFGDDISQMARDIRAELGLPNLPFLMGEYETGASGEFAPTLPWPAIVLEQSRQVATKLTNSTVISSQGIAMQDDHHYSWPAGQTEFAKRCVTAIQSKGWLAGGTASAMQPLLSRAPSRVKLQFLEGMGAKVAVRDGVPYFIDGKIVINNVRIHAIRHP